jgi:hypothetical protein
MAKNNIENAYVTAPVLCIKFTLLRLGSEKILSFQDRFFKYSSEAYIPSFIALIADSIIAKAMP